MNSEQELVQAFEGSQRRRNLVITVITGIVIAGFIGLKLYQHHLASELEKPIEVRSEVRVPAY